jgi:hypothetical protein
MTGGKQRQFAWMIIGLWCATSAAYAGTIGIHSLSLSANSLGLYEPLTVSFNLSKTYSNPYDPDLIDARFEFTGPSGIPRIIPAYWTNGAPPWRAKIVPLEVGPHTCRIRVSDSAGDTGIAAASFTAVESNARGFIRIDSRNPRYLRFDNGDPYLPVGQNVCWYGGHSAFNTWLDNMAAVGQNWTRYWLVPYVGQDIEWGGGTSFQLGRYSQGNAQLLDNMFEAARTREIYVQACLDSFNGWNLTTYANWEENPYSTANGGMCALPIDFFTNAEAQRFARRRFRYIIARWAWNPAILCWEFFNEVDLVGTPGAKFFGNELQIAAWHQAMAQYVRSIDPFEHLRSTSFADDGPRSSYAPFWELPEMEIAQVHEYSNTYPLNHVWYIRSVREFNKPVILGEANASGTPDNLDSNGQSLHDIIWAAAMVESGAMSWWWDGWIHPKNLYYRFQPLTAFLQGEDWAPQQLAPLDYTVLSGHGTPQFYGSGGPGHAYVYILNPQGPVSGLQLRLNQVQRSGPYEIEWWDTYSSSPFHTEPATGQAGGLIVSVPNFGRDIAVKIRHMGPALETTVRHIQASSFVRHPAEPASFGVRNTGTGTIDYAITVDASWCEVIPAYGSVTTQTDIIAVNFTPEQLPAGLHECTITVADLSGENPPATVSVALTVKTAPADADGDGDVDQDDFGMFQVCLSGPGITQADPDCHWARLDNDLDVDLDDLALFQGCMSGADVLSNPYCLE